MSRCVGTVTYARSFDFGSLVHLEAGGRRCDRVVMVIGAHPVTNRTVYVGLALQDLETGRPCGGEVRFNAHQAHLAPEAVWSLPAARGVHTA